MIISKSIRLFFVLFASCLLLACSKDKEEQESYYSGYIVDKGVELSVKGIVGDTKIDKNLELPVIPAYRFSQIYYQEDGSKKITLKRRAYNNYCQMEIFIYMDEDNQLTDCSCYYRLSILANTKAIVLVNDNASDLINISNFSFDEETSKLDFSFEIDVDIEDQDYTIDGEVDVEVYEIIK